jgi:hypothetical protein
MNLSFDKVLCSQSYGHRYTYVQRLLNPNPPLFAPQATHVSDSRQLTQQSLGQATPDYGTSAKKSVLSKVECRHSSRLLSKLRRLRTAVQRGLPRAPGGFLVDDTAVAQNASQLREWGDTFGRARRANANSVP